MAAVVTDGAGVVIKLNVEFVPEKVPPCWLFRLAAIEDGLKKLAEPILC